RRPRPTTPSESGGRSARAELLVEALAVAPPAARRAVEAGIGSLDQHGFLTRTSPHEIQFLARCTATALAQALHAVREVGPAGVACFDARSFLLAQIDELSQESSQPGEWVLGRRIVDQHLPALAAGDVAALAAALSADVTEVQSAGALIR